MTGRGSRELVQIAEGVWQGWNEDDRITLIELGPDGLKVLIAEILAVIRSKKSVIPSALSS